MISELSDLAALVRHYSPNFVLQFNTKPGLKTKISQLLVILTDPKKDLTGDAIAKSLGYKGENSKGFKMLCARLEDKLLSVLVLMDYKQNASEVKKKTFEIYKGFLQGQMLNANNRRKLAIRILEKTLHEALKYETTHLIVSILERLTIHYSFMSRNDKKYKKYAKLKEQMMKNLVAEHEAETMYNELSNVALFKAKSHVDYLNKISKQFASKLEEGQKTITTYRYNLLAYEVRQFHLNLRGDYQESIDLCNEALDYLSDKPFFNKSTLSGFSTPKVDAYLNLQQYEKATQEIKSLFKHLTKESFNWFKNQRKLFFVYSLQNKYQEMYRLTSEMTDPKLYKKNQTFLENWKIREAYINFLIRAKVVKEEKEYPLKNFRLARFLNEVPTFSKDKEGVNTAILIVQILFFIVDGRLDKVQGKLDALTKYCHRYLRRDETYRFNCFIKMLLRLPEAEFNPIRTQRYVKKYYEKLEAYPREKTIENFSAEVIGFEELWDIIIQTLPRKGYRIRKKAISVT